MLQIVALAAKDLRLLLRDRMALFWALIFPVAFGVFVGGVLSAGVSHDTARLRLAVLDQTTDDAGATFVEELRQQGRIETRGFAERDAAEAAVRRGEQLGWLRLPPGFASDPRVPVELGTDPSRPTESALLRAELGAALTKRAKGGSLGAQEDALLREVAHTSWAAPSSAREVVFAPTILWGLLGCAATFAIAIAVERTQGTHLRLSAAPLGRGKLLAGKALAAAVACLADALVLLGIGRVGFGVTWHSSLLLALALAAVTLCFVGLTLFLSTLGKTEQAVSGAGWATLLFMAMLGGAMVPVAFMPSWMQLLSNLSPVKWGILALEGALFRQFEPMDFALPCGVLAGIGLAGFFAALYALRGERA